MVQGNDNQDMSFNGCLFDHALLLNFLPAQACQMIIPRVVLKCFLETRKVLLPEIIESNKLWYTYRTIIGIEVILMHDSGGTMISNVRPCEVEDNMEKTRKKKEEEKKEKKR